MHYRQHLLNILRTTKFLSPNTRVVTASASALRHAPSKRPEPSSSFPWPSPATHGWAGTPGPRLAWTPSPTFSSGPRQIHSVLNAFSAFGVQPSSSFSPVPLQAVASPVAETRKGSELATHSYPTRVWHQNCLINCTFRVQSCQNRTGARGEVAPRLMRVHSMIITVPMDCAGMANT